MPFTRAEYGGRISIAGRATSTLAKSIAREWRNGASYGGVGGGGESSLDFFQLKQPQSVFEMMKEKHIFNDTFKQCRMRVLLEICEATRLTSQLTVGPTSLEPPPPASTPLRLVVVPRVSRADRGVFRRGERSRKRAARGE